MKTTTILIVCFTVCVTSMLQAQSPEILAQSAMLNADQSYAEGKYSDCLNFLKEAETLIGKPTIRIQYLKVKSLLARYNQDIHDKSILNINNALNLYFEIPLPDDYPKEKYDEMLMLAVKVKKWTDTYNVNETQRIRKNSVDSTFVMSNVVKINKYIDQNEVSFAHKLWVEIIKNKYYSDRQIPKVDVLKLYEINQAKKHKFDSITNIADNYKLEAKVLSRRGWNFVGIGTAGVVVGAIMLFSAPLGDMNGFQQAGVFIELASLFTVVMEYPTVLKAKKIYNLEKETRRKANLYISVSPIINSNDIGVHFACRF